MYIRLNLYVSKKKKIIFPCISHRVACQPCELSPPWAFQDLWPSSTTEHGCPSWCPTGQHVVRATLPLHFSVVSAPWSPHHPPYRLWLPLILRVSMWSPHAPCNSATRYWECSSLMDCKWLQWLGILIGIDRIIVSPSVPWNACQNSCSIRDLRWQ